MRILIWPQGTVKKSNPPFEIEKRERERERQREREREREKKEHVGISSRCIERMKLDDVRHCERSRGIHNSIIIEFTRNAADLNLDGANELMTMLIVTCAYTHVRKINASFDYSRFVQSRWSGTT
jgi:hypothetical protein